MAFNRVILVGNMVSDPELKVTPSGVNVTRFSIAVARRFSKEQEVDFFTIVAWRQLSAFICRFFKKGMPILISGTLQNNNWTDNQGTKHFTCEILADEATFVERKQGEEAPSAPPAPSYAGTDGFEDLANDDELPF